MESETTVFLRDSTLCFPVFFKSEETKEDSQRDLEDESYLFNDEPYLFNDEGGYDFEDDFVEEEGMDDVKEAADNNPAPDRLPSGDSADTQISHPDDDSDGPLGNTKEADEHSAVNEPDEKGIVIAMQLVKIVST